MRGLLDNCVDHRFARLISGHQIVHARDRGWHELSNGALLAAAESAGFDVLVTVDKNIRFQQDFSRRTISLITLDSLLVSLAHIAPLAPALQEQLDKGIPPGSVIVIGA